MDWAFLGGKRTPFFLGAVVLYIVYMTFPIFSDLTGIPIEVPAIALTLVGVILYPRAIKNTVFRYACIYLSIIFIYVFVGKKITIGIGSLADTKKVIIEAAWILPSVIIYSCLQYLNDRKAYKIIAISSISALIASFVYLLPILLIHSNVLRADTQAIIDGTAGFGLPNYTLMHAYVFAIPALCYSFKLSQNKFVWAGIILLFYYIIIHTYVTTSLFVTTVIIIAALLYKQNSKKGIMVFALIAVIVYLFYLIGLWSAIIDLILPIFQGTSVEYKLIDIKDSLTFGKIEGGSLVDRMDYHQMSIDAFFSNPLFGNKNIGGHSTLLDRLGGMGLVVFIPFIMIFISFIKSFKGIFITNSAKFFWFCTILSVAVFLYNKGLFGAEGWLFFFVIAPSLLIYIQDKAELNPDK